MKRRFKAVGHFKDVLMKPTYTCLRKCPRTLERFVLGTFLMKLAPGLPLRFHVFSVKLKETTMPIIFN